jgi:hypothetical protein
MAAKKKRPRERNRPRAGGKKVEAKRYPVATLHSRGKKPRVVYNDELDDPALFPPATPAEKRATERLVKKGVLVRGPDYGKFTDFEPVDVKPGGKTGSEIIREERDAGW